MISRMLSPFFISELTAFYLHLEFFPDHFGFLCTSDEGGKCAMLSIFGVSQQNAHGYPMPPTLERI